MEILAYGGGVQSVAMALLVLDGTLSAPDAIIAADTGREMPSTWAYAARYIQPRLVAAGMTLHIASHDLATVDLYAKNGDLLLPAFTTTGKLHTYCSNEWKARVMSRYVRRVLNDERPIVSWLGFTLDEKRRAHDAPDRRFPLLELLLTRADCEHIITAHDLPLPAKSRCWICPHQTNAEWREVRDQVSLWSQACRVDHEIREADERGAVYLHHSAVPLANAVLDERPNPPGRQCGLGLCFR